MTDWKDSKFEKGRKAHIKHQIVKKNQCRKEAMVEYSKNSSELYKPIIPSQPSTSHRSPPRIFKKSISPNYQRQKSSHSSQKHTEKEKIQKNTNLVTEDEFLKKGYEEITNK